jgi:SAM-dependent methyltransferase
LDLVLSLKPTPLANALISANQLDLQEPSIPLDVFACRECEHIQLLDVVDPEVLFRDYVYVSGTSAVYVDYLREYSLDVAGKHHLETGSLVIEIGSNDGTLLHHFKDQGMRVLGIDPARNLAGLAAESGIETICDFFSPELAEEILETHGQASVAMANHVFAHADDLESIVKGVRRILTPDGVFVFEVSYLLDVYRSVLFDTIYHEHVSYHTVGPLVDFFQRLGMQLVNAQRVSHQGGSLRCTVQLAGGPWAVEPSVQQLISLESQELGADLPETFRKFGERIDVERHRLTELLAELSAHGKRVAGYGAPAKTTTLMHHFELDSSQIEFIVDDSAFKQGLYTPGLHIPIVPSEEIYLRKPDYLLVLAWNFADSIIAKHKAFSEAGGKFIVPLPTFRVV